MIKNTAIRMQSADNILFGENKKAHPLGVGGMSIDMAYDSALIQLNAEAYDSATEFQLYTESVLRSLTKFTDTCRGASCISIYKESKAKALLDKIKAWFKKAWAYLKKKATQIKDWVKRLFTRKSKKAKTTPPTGNQSEQAKQALLVLDEKASTTQKVAEVIGKGIEEGLKSIAREIFSKNNLKYGNSDIKALALATVEAAHRHAGTNNEELPPSAKDFWDTCKGTEYEKSAVAAIAVMYICATGVYPYIPSKIMDYIDSKEANGVKLNSQDIFQGTGSLMGEGLTMGVIELYAHVFEHVEKMYGVISNTAWGADVKRAKVLALHNVDKLITTSHEIMELASSIDEHGLNELSSVKEFSKRMAESLSDFDGVVANPKSIVSEVTLDSLMAKADSYVKQYEVFMVVDMYNELNDLDSLVEGLSKNATKANGEPLTDEDLADIYKSMIACVNPLIKVANSLGMTAAILFRSLSDVEEEMVGFYGSNISADSVPVTAIGKAIAEDAEMSSRMMKRLGFIK